MDFRELSFVQASLQIEFIVRSQKKTFGKKKCRPPAKLLYIVHGLLAVGQFAVVQFAVKKVLVSVKLG